MAPSRRRARGLWPILALAALTPLADAQSCVPLAGSTTCPAFNKSSISTSDANLLGIYPFLSYVTTTQDFDQQLNDFIKQDYVKIKFQTLLGCSNVTLDNTTGYYARYTLSTICNAIVQNSIQPCNLSPQQAPPLCADTCAESATSEEQIAASQQLCGTPGPDYMSQIRADFTNCALPANSLSGACITGEANEPDECGFSGNLGGLCSYCGASSPNATDSCCGASNVTHRCSGIVLPSASSVPPLFPSSTSKASSTATSAAATAAAAASNSSAHGLSGGAIAGIVIGSLIGFALLLGLLIMCCLCLRRRRGSRFGSPRSQRSGAALAQAAPNNEKSPTQPPPGGRIARMTALEGSSDEHRSGLDPMLAAEKRRYDQSDSDPYGDSTPSRGGAGVQPTRRQGSLSSQSALGAIGGATTGEETTSPSHGQYSSPGEMGSGQSEQLVKFKDYYSTDDIHPHDRVAVLWAYSPRAPDEFELDRGDMLRVVGIWDDGWATGVRISDRAETFEPGHNPQRDSGISQASGEVPKSPAADGEVRAFPLVCVCLPEHWRKTIEGEGSTDSASPPPPREGPFDRF